MEADGEIAETIAAPDGAWSVDVTADPAWDGALPEWRAVVAKVAAAAQPSIAEALAEAGCLGASEVALLLADDATVRDLNRDWREKDSATNVLSFATWWDDECPPPPAGAPVHLGDIAVARETVLAEAAESGTRPADHFAHLVLHGVLHLLGYDHMEDDEATAMERLETDLLNGLGIADPHAADLVHGDHRDD